MTSSFIILMPQASVDQITCVFRRLIPLDGECIKSRALLDSEQVRLIFKSRGKDLADKAALSLAAHQLTYFEVRSGEALKAVLQVFPRHEPFMNVPHQPEDSMVAFVTCTLEETSACRQAIESASPRV